MRWIMDSNQVPKGSQDFDIGEWERTGIKPGEGKTFSIIQPIISPSLSMKPIPDPRPLIFDLRHLGEETEP